MKWFFFFFSFVSLGFCSGSKQVFSKYPNPYFFETGTFRGDGTQLALDAGFQKVISIELSEAYYKKSLDRFKNDHRVRIMQGDASQLIWPLIEKIDAPITFWLDSHIHIAGTARGQSNTTLLQELEAIRRHPIKTHTIMIDDVRLLSTDHLDNISLKEILDLIYLINPNYTIVFEDGYVPRDILVAYIQEKE